MKNNYKTFIDDAGQDDKFEAVKEEIEKNPDLVNLTDEMGFTALMVAAMEGNLKLVTFLIANGANVNLKNKADQTALMLAATKGKDDVVAKLKANGAGVSINDGDSVYGNTTLMNTVVAGQLSTVDLLLSFQPELDIDAVNQYGQTALILAAIECYDNQEAIIRSLFDAGADQTIMDANGHSVLQQRLLRAHTATLINNIVNNQPPQNIVSSKTAKL